MGRAVTVANERTRIKSVVKWPIPSSECARAKFRNDIFLFNTYKSYFILYINIYYVVKIIAKTQ